MCWGAALRPRPADTWARGGPTTASHPRGTGALRPLRGVVVLPLSDPPTPRMHLRLPPCTPLRRYSTTPAVFTRGRTTRHVVRIEETHVVLGRRPTDGRRSVACRQPDAAPQGWRVCPTLSTTVQHPRRGARCVGWSSWAEGVSRLTRSTCVHGAFTHQCWPVEEYI
jgi:hypothetical protein